MFELVVVSMIAVLVLGIAFYQSYRDKKRMKRGMQRRKATPTKDGEQGKQPLKPR